MVFFSYVSYFKKKCHTEINVDYKKKKKIQSYWVFSVYNIYSRKNPYFIYFNQSGNPYNGSLKVEARQVSLFPVLPSVTWNFKF